MRCGLHRDSPPNCHWVVDWWSTRRQRLQRIPWAKHARKTMGINQGWGWGLAGSSVPRIVRFESCTPNLSAPKSHDFFCPCKAIRLFKAPRCVISLWTKITNEPEHCVALRLKNRQSIPRSTKHSLGHFPSGAFGHSCKWQLASQAMRDFSAVGPEIVRCKASRWFWRPRRYFQFWALFDDFVHVLQKFCQFQSIWIKIFIKPPDARRISEGVQNGFWKGFWRDLWRVLVLVFVSEWPFKTLSKRFQEPFKIFSRRCSRFPGLKKSVPGSGRSCSKKWKKLLTFAAQIALWDPENDFPGVFCIGFLVGIFVRQKSFFVVFAWFLNEGFCKSGWQPTWDYKNAFGVFPDNGATIKLKRFWFWFLGVCSS